MVCVRLKCNTRLYQIASLGRFHEREPNVDMCYQMISLVSYTAIACLRLTSLWLHVINLRSLVRFSFIHHSVAYVKFQPDWSINLLLAAETLHIGVVITKPHPLTHPCVVNKLTLSLGDHMPNLSLVGPLNSFWKPKQIPLGMVMTKPHPLPHPQLMTLT